jgi:DNA-directed RNA polymerase specialized sigma24 family protein
MLANEIESVFFMEREIDLLYTRLKRAESLYKSPVFDGTPRVKGNITDISKKLADVETLRGRVEAKITALKAMRENVEEAIESIEDRELRSIVRMRVVDRLSFREIGDELYMAHTTAMRRYNKYMHGELGGTYLAKKRRKVMPKIVIED